MIKPILQSIVILSSLILWHQPNASEPPVEWISLINKDQKKALTERVMAIQAQTLPYCLKNARDSTWHSLKTHHKHLPRNKIAYKLLVIWYLDKRLEALGEMPLGAKVKEPRASTEDTSEAGGGAATGDEKT